MIIVFSGSCSRERSRATFKFSLQVVAYQFKIHVSQNNGNNILKEVGMIGSDNR